MKAAGANLIVLTCNDCCVSDVAAGVRHLMAAVMEVAAPEAWKPAPAAYQHAVKTLGLQPHEVGLTSEAIMISLP